MNRLAPDADDARFLRRFMMIVAIVAVAAALFVSGDFLILAFGSILGAIVIQAIAETYEDHLHLPSRVALGLGIITVIALIGFLGWLFGVAFRQQVNILIEQLPRLLDQLTAYVSQSPVGARVAEAVRAAFAGSRIAQDIGGLAQGAAEMVLNALLVLVGAIFFAVNPRIYERGFLLLMPRHLRAPVEDALGDTASTLRLWLRAQLIQMTSMGLMVGVGLWLVGVPWAAAMGLLTGLSEFIPYIGPLAAMLPALGLAAIQSTQSVVWALVVFAVVRIVQTNFVTPFVTSRVVAIPPAVTLFSILVIGAVFGLYGLFFSAAILVVVYSLIRSLYLREMLGENIPRSTHRTLFDSRGRRRDSPESAD